MRKSRFYIYSNTLKTTSIYLIFSLSIQNCQSNFIECRMKEKEITTKIEKEDTLANIELGSGAIQENPNQNTIPISQKQYSAKQVGVFCGLSSIIIIIVTSLICYYLFNIEKRDCIHGLLDGRKIPIPHESLLTCHCNNFYREDNELISNCTVSFEYSGSAVQWTPRDENTCSEAFSICPQKI